MGWKDLMKNVTDKATSVAETAQAKFEEQKQLSAIKKEEQNVLKYFKLNADEYEYEEIYKQKEPECTVEVTFRLYLCSSDYAVQVVRVLKKENENG